MKFSFIDIEVRENGFPVDFLRTYLIWKSTFQFFGKNMFKHDPLKHFTQ